MKNKEKFHDQIFAIACKGDRIAITDNKVCECKLTSCLDCGFYIKRNKPCPELIAEWCEAECAEPRKEAER